MLGLDQLHELRVLRVVHVRAERHVVDRDLSRDRVALHRGDLFGLGEDFLVIHRVKRA